MMRHLFKLPCNEKCTDNHLNNSCVMHLRLLFNAPRPLNCSLIDLIRWKNLRHFHPFEWHRSWFRTTFEHLIDAATFRTIVCASKATELCAKHSKQFHPTKNLIHVFMAIYKRLMFWERKKEQQHNIHQFGDSNWGRKWQFPQHLLSVMFISWHDSHTKNK